MAWISFVSGPTNALVSDGDCKNDLNSLKYQIMVRYDTTSESCYSFSSVLFRIRIFFLEFKAGNKRLSVIPIEKAPAKVVQDSGDRSWS